MNKGIHKYNLFVFYILFKDKNITYVLFDKHITLGIKNTFVR